MNAFSPENIMVPDSYTIVDDLALGRPDLTTTYLNTETFGLVVVPFGGLPHDYDYSQHLSKLKGSAGAVTRHHGRFIGIEYDPSVNLAPLPDFVNAQMRNRRISFEQRSQQLLRPLRAVGVALLRAYWLTGELPRATIDSIAIACHDIDHAEVLPPFTATSQLTPTALMYDMAVEVAERRDILPGIQDVLINNLRTVGHELK